MDELILPLWTGGIEGIDKLLLAPAVAIRVLALAGESWVGVGLGRVLIESGGDAAETVVFEESIGLFSEGGVSGRDFSGGKGEIHEVSPGAVGVFTRGVGLLLDEISNVLYAAHPWRCG